MLSPPENGIAASRATTATKAASHAPRDQVVSIDNAASIFLAAKHPKSFVTLDDADHLVTRGEDAEYAAGVIASWAQRYLDLRPPAPPPGAPGWPSPTRGWDEARKLPRRSWSR